MTLVCISPPVSFSSWAFKILKALGMCPGDQQISEKCVNEHLGKDAEAYEGQLFSRSSACNAHSSRPLN